jgi:hypothetical protein
MKFVVGLSRVRGLMVSRMRCEDILLRKDGCRCRVLVGIVIGGDVIAWVQDKGCSTQMPNAAKLQITRHLCLSLRN